MAHPEVTGRKQSRRRPRKKPEGVEREAYSISEFCASCGISIQSFYKHEADMPRTFNVGARRLISREAAAAWRAEREAAAKKAASKAETAAS
jgi:hypothetical protein